MQSVSKVFSAHSHDALWKSVGREPSGNPFNSLVQLEYDHGIPRNPFINAGAIAVELESYVCTPICCREAATPCCSCYDHNLATGISMWTMWWQRLRRKRGTGTTHSKSCKILNNPVDSVLQAYFRLCAIKISCVDLARTGLLLARLGTDVKGHQF
jgi:glutaminase